MTAAFKRGYKIEETDQEITIAMHPTQSDFSEYCIRVESKSEVKALDLAHVLSLYAEEIFNDCTEKNHTEAEF